MEEFKRCLYPYSRYEINENGIIRNFLTKINKKTRLNYQGYLVVSLVNDFVDNNKYKIDTVRVHKIVILNFISQYISK